MFENREYMFENRGTCLRKGQGGAWFEKIGKGNVFEKKGKDF